MTDPVDRRPLAVVLLSGGMDSCVTAGIAARDHELALLHVNYGQRTQRRELRAFEAIADHYLVSCRLVVDLPAIAHVGGSSLLAGGPAVPDAAFVEGQIPSTYVPFRNGQILAVAAAWAEVLEAQAIYVGAVEQDSSGYPDCRRPFFDAYERAIQLGTGATSLLRIHTPLVELSKAQIVRRGIDLGAPLHLTWSCYRDEDLACGRCESCILRLRGFAGAGVDDPVPYQDPATGPGSTLPPRVD
ncbi:MAG: 7-cyano-7-deazaguanine synthase QueC [Pseudomonadota bacterium]